jgi:hypothetical protein
MLLLKLLLKAVLLPVILALTIMEWVGVFLTSFGSVILFILSGIVFLIAIAGLVIAHEPWPEVLKYLGLSCGIFLVNVIADWLVEKIGTLSASLKQFLKG